LCASTLAQLKTDSTILTFQEAVRIALMNSVTLNTQRNQLELAQTQKNASIAGIAPNISLNGSATQFNGNSFNQQTGTVINGIRDNVSGSLNANMNIFSGFGRLNTIRQYANAFDAQAYFVDRTQQDVINTVSTQYLQALLDVELIRIAHENFLVQEKQLKQIHEFVQVGSRSPVDEYNQNALTKAAELRYVQAEVTLTNDMALLTQTLLVDPFDNYAVRKPAWDINQIAGQPADLEQMLATAKQHRGDYQRALKNELATRYATSASRSLSLPSLTAFFNYGSGYNYQHNVPDSATYSNIDYVLVNPSPGNYVLNKVETRTTTVNPDLPRPFAEQFKTNNVYKSYGLQLTIPLFNGLQNRTAFVQQRTLYKNAQVTKSNAEIQLKNDVLRTARNFDGAKKAYAITLDQLKAAEMAMQYETERYNLGVTNLVEYAAANGRYVQAQTDKAQAEFRLLFQKVLLEYAVGTLRIEDLE